MKRRVLLIFLLLMCLTSAAFAQGGQRVYTDGDFQYIVLPDGTAEVVGYTGRYADATIVVPDYLGGRRVTRIGDYVLWGGDTVAALQLPDSITYIGVWAVSDLYEIQKINIPLSLTSVGEGAMCALGYTGSLILPEGFTSSGAAAFSALKVTEVILPSTFTHIPNYCFERCWDLESICIPEGVESIGDHAFSFCSKLKTVILPSTLKKIGESAFNNEEEYVWDGTKSVHVSYNDLITFLVLENTWAANWCREQGVNYRIVNEAEYAELTAVKAPAGSGSAQSTGTSGSWFIGETAVVIAESANARTGAGTEYNKVGRVMRDERYQILDTAEAANGRTWFKIQLTDGTLAWVSSGVCEVNGQIY